MSKISIQELASVISKKHGITQKDAGAFVSVLFEVVATGLETDRQVKIKGLGTFKVIDVRDRESVNVNTGERIVIDGRSKITFTPDAIIRDIVNRPFAQFETVIINDGVDIEEFEKIDRQVEELVTVCEHHEDTVMEENETIGNDIPEDPCLSPVSVELHSDNSSDETVASSDDGESFVEEALNVIDASVTEETGEIMTSINDDEKSKPVNIINTPEPAHVSVVEDKLTNMEETSEEDDCDEERSHGNMLRRVLIFVIILLLMSGAAAYMGFYFGQKSVTGNNTLVNGVEKTDDNVVKTQVVIKKDSADTDDETAVLVKDTVKECGVADVAKVSDVPQKTVSESVKTKNSENESKVAFSEKYDNANVMVRTGAYRIVGVESSVVIRKGQTLSSVSKAMLGPGMECYIEALNGVSEVKEGQTLKIPKLELRKKKNK